MMQTLKFSFAAAAILPACLYAQQTFSGPAQAGRGFELFTKTARPYACTTCHAIGAKDATPGPDLKMWSKLAPRATAMAISATLTEKTLWFETKTVQFPGMKVSESADSVQAFDLSKTPPEMRTIAKGDIVSAKPNSTWKHPPGTAKLSLEEIADLVAYIRFAGNGDKRAISPDEVQ